MAMLNARDSKWFMLKDIIILLKGNFTLCLMKGKVKIVVVMILLQIIMMMTLSYVEYKLRYAKDNFDPYWMEGKEKIMVIIFSPCWMERKGKRVINISPCSMEIKMNNDKSYTMLNGK